MTRTNSCQGQESACLHSDRCGGCLYQGIPYEEQLENKRRDVETELVKSGLNPALAQSVEPSPALYGYRNKMEYTFGNEYRDAPLSLGLHRRKSFMSIVHTDECRIVPPEFNDILRATHALCVDAGYDFYHKKRHEGLLRTLVVRKGMRTGELLVNIVTTSQGHFDADAFCRMLLELPFADRFAGILHTVNDGVADTVRCDTLHVLYGRDYYVEQLMGLEFNVGAFSFFQTNVDAVERMFNRAISSISSLDGKTVWDLYSGTGTLAMTLAQSARQSIGVEISEESVEMARQSAARNGLGNCSFIAGDVLRVLDSLEPKPDIIVVDPPRAGIHPKALKKIVSVGVPEVLYISCNPKTMIRDLAQAMEAGYRLASFQAFDNFAFTRHIEAVSLLSLDG